MSLFVLLLIWPLIAAELQSVVVIYRHGDRTPIDPYPTDPYKNASYWPVGFGQLLNKGKQRHYELGKWFRSRYHDFLPLKYSENDIYIRSTDVDRTLMSAEANLAGLYPPHGPQIWNPDFPWQPIPIHTEPESEDPLLEMKSPCPKYDKLLKDLFKTKFFVDIAHLNHDLYAYLTRNSGVEVTDMKRLEYLYNTFTIEQSFNYTLPEWALKVYPDKMTEWAHLSFATPTFTPGLSRLKAGLLFNEILNHFTNATDDFAPNKKFLMFSGHDITIANVLNSMGTFQYHSPPYASTIIFELHSFQNSFSTGGRDFFVNLFYKNSSEIQAINLKGCDFNCSFDKFAALLAPIRLNRQQWDKECRLGLLQLDRFEIVVLMSVLLSSLLILTIALICLKLIKRDREGVTTYMQLPNDEEIA